MPTYNETLAADKTDEAVITPAAGKKVKIEKIVVKNSPGAAEVKLSGNSIHKVSASTLAACGLGGVAKATGVVDAPVILTALTGTEVVIDYTEV